MRASVILAAGGKSVRFFTGRKKNPKRTFPGQPLITRSKLFCELNGKPLLSYSLDVFTRAKFVSEIILCCPQKQLLAIRKWVIASGWKKVKVLSGGATRGESVYKGFLLASKKNDWMMIHDAARPLLSYDSLQRLWHRVHKRQVAGIILASKVIPTIKRVDAENRILGTLNRSVLWAAETPQVLNRRLLEKVYKRFPEAFLATDEASLLEAMGECVEVLENLDWNPKITTAHDLRLAELSFAGDQSEYLTGLGKDLHRLVKGRSLYLGGILIPSKAGSVGHSDGDALLHSIADAILGILCEGDIGQWFSDKNPKYKNLKSSKILKFVLEKARLKKWTLSHIDTVIHLETPKLGTWKEKIRKRIAMLTKIKIEKVSVKAKTGEGLGAIGKGKAVACDAIVTMKRSDL